MSNTPPSEAALDAQEVARMLRVSYRKVLDLAERGDLSYFTVGNQYRFLRSDVERYITDHRGGKKS